MKFFSENGQFKTAQDKKFFDACVSNPKYVKYTRLRTDADAKTIRTKNDAVGIIADSIRRSIMPEEVIEKLCKANDTHEFKDAYAFNKAVRKHITDLCSAHNGKILQEKRRIEELTRQRAEHVLEKFGVATVSELIDMLVANEVHRVEGCYSPFHTGTTLEEIFNTCFRHGLSPLVCRTMLYVSNLVRLGCEVQEEHIMHALSYDICPGEFMSKMANHDTNSQLYRYVIAGLTRCTRVEQRNVWSIVTAYAVYV